MSQTHDRSEANDSEEDRELRAVAALLRALPAPEPPEGLSGRVMAEVQRRESRPRVVRVAFRRAEALVTTAVAAGIGAVVLVTAMQSGLTTFGASELEPTPELEPFSARRVLAPTSPVVARLPQPVAPVFVALPVADLHAVHQRAEPPAQLSGAVVDLRLGVANPLDRRLDQELNSLLLDPLAFYARLQQMARPEPFMERLIERATLRGDATQIALRLRMRAPEHPSTVALVDRLLHASATRDPRL